MPLSPDEFHAHAVAAADAEGRLPLWDDLLPEYPADVADADALVVARAVEQSYGGRLAD